MTADGRLPAGDAMDAASQAAQQAKEALEKAQVEPSGGFKMSLENRAATFATIAASLSQYAVAERGWRF